MEETGALVVAERGAGAELPQEYVHAGVQHVCPGGVAEGVPGLPDYGQSVEQVLHAQDLDQCLLLRLGHNQQQDQ